MAEVVSDISDPRPTAKSGRHSRFTAAQDLVIAREVAAANAHTSHYGDTRKRFETAASRVTENPLFQGTITWKTVQDRYKRLQEQYDTNDTANARLSGVGGGEMGELADLLMTMREARDDYVAEKTAAKDAERRRDADKERVGMDLMERAMRRPRLEDDEGSEKDPDEMPSSKKRRVSMGARERSELDNFGTHLKEGELARVGLEEARLDFERAKDALDRVERKEERDAQLVRANMDREERERERAATQKLDLDKFKAMLEMFSKHK